MPVSVRLPALTAATHQCTVSTTAPTSLSAFTFRFAGTTALSIRTPNNSSPARAEIGQYLTGAAAPTGTAELCIADGVTHEAIVAFIRDTQTYIRANNPATDTLGAPEMVRAAQTILDYVRVNTLKAL